jgi:hypothetical protein
MNEPVMKKMEVDYKYNDYENKIKELERFNKDYVSHKE